MTSFALLFTLAAFGISEATYLVKSRLANQKPVCLTGEQCNVVLRSKYATLFGVHNDILGVVFYVTMAVLTALLVLEVQPLWFLVLCTYVLVGTGAVMSLFLMFLQWRVIKAWCTWCIMSAFTNWAMALVVVLSNFLVYAQR